jgi:outer membrane protein TolC
MKSRASALAGSWVLAQVTVSLILGCSPSYYARDADKEVDAILAEREQQVLGNRANEVQRPNEPVEEDQGPPSPASEEGRVTFNLQGALRQAVLTNREYQTRREDLYLEGLSLTLTRHDFGPIFTSTLATLYSDNEHQPKTLLSTGDLSISQILATGGSVKLTGLLSNTRFTGAGSSADGDGFGSSAGVHLNQPLLRGAGYMASHEPLTQAERSLVYAIRDFELFREQFSIDIARGYYDLVSAKRQLKNDEENSHNFTKLRERSEAMQKVDLATQQDVVLARRQELQAQNDYLTSRQNYELRLDQFKIRLGLTPETKIELEEETLEQKPVRIGEQEAIEIALNNRIDLTTQRQQVEDALRQVDIAVNGLLPALDLDANYLANGSIDQAFGRSLPEDRFANVGLRLEVPLDQMAERNAYRASLIQRDRVQRNYSERVDQTGLQVRADLRELKRIGQSIEIAIDGIESDKKGLVIARLRYENGEIGSRDVTETQQGLLTATNGLIQLQVDYVIARLILLRDLGLLFIDDEGMWQE